MNDGERLAAYLVGELDPAQRRELEARLEQEPSLRLRLERIRRSDDALASLPEVTARPEFSRRLRTELRGELSAARVAEDTDELAAQRRRRQPGTPRWLAPLGVAAAALALFAVVGVGLSSMGGSDDSADTTSLSGSDAEMDAGVAEEAAQPGPVIVAQGRSYDTEDVGQVADHPAFQPILGQGSGAARATSESYRSQLGVGDGSPAAQTTEDDGADVPAEGDAAPAAESEPLTALVEGQATDEELAAVQRCLPPLFADGGTLVPVYVELATFEGEPAIIYGLVAEDRETGILSRTEIWVVAQDSCEVRYFTQS